MQKLKAIIFDLDNTLCNTTKALDPSFSTCYKYLANYYPNIDKTEFNKLHREVFNKLTRHLKIPLYSSQALFWHEMFDGLGLKYNPKIIAELVLLLNDELAKNVELFPGIEQMLGEIKKLNLKTAVLSNGAYIDKALRFEFLNLQSHIDLLVSTDLIRRDKPSSRPFNFTLARLGVKAGEAVMLGDELEADIKGASQAGIKTIYNKWNEQKLLHEDKSIKPDYVVHKPEAVVEIVRKML